MRVKSHIVPCFGQLKHFSIRDSWLWSSSDGNWNIWISSSMANQGRCFDGFKRKIFGELLAIWYHLLITVRKGNAERLHCLELQEYWYPFPVTHDISYNVISLFFIIVRHFFQNASQESLWIALCNRCLYLLNRWRCEHSVEERAVSSHLTDPWVLITACDRTLKY